METHDIVNAYILTGQKIDSLWNFYVTVHLAIVGALFYGKRLRKSHLIIFGIGYTLFSIINWRAKSNEYDFYNALVAELQDRELSSLSIGTYFASYDATDRYAINFFVHLLSAIAIVILCRSSQRVHRNS